ncbi:hypothetical protein [Desulfatibacillum aliphaticivorans]|uniref:hypothetical protein n=1 Tax=Desulfatibacillum aliphaticivorans TaxID=218208 RepID=UPI000489C7CA|nr:hypothetical protein [Desulfatibacillum aliphaticivorans]
MPAEIQQIIQEITKLVQQNQVVGIIIAIIAIIIVLAIVVFILKTLFKIITLPFRLLFGKKTTQETSHLHRSDGWGGQPHVDLYEKDSKGKTIKQDHGHSPTIHPPTKDEDGAIKLPGKEHLPPPYGDIEFKKRKK